MSNEKYQFEDAMKVKIEDVGNYLMSLSEPTDYESCCLNVAKAGLSAMNAMASKCGITGFQASMALMYIIREWQFSNNKTGFRIVDFDNFLYPQFKSKMNTIPKSVWETIQKEAQRNLIKHPDSHPDVIRHWQAIVNGQVPFGYGISED